MKFSILMSIYAGETRQNLEACFESLIVQSLLADELILVEDGPLSPDLVSLIQFYRAKLRITSIKLEHNNGLGRALNVGLKSCSNEIIARMDTDDIALPRRFEIQLKYMKDNPRVDACSGAIEEFGDDINKVRVRRLPSNHEELKSLAMSRSPLFHPAVMFKRSVVMSVGGYPEFRNSQDYALWALLLVSGYRLGNVPQTLVRMRVGNAIKKRRGWRYLKQEIKVLSFQRSINFLSTPRFCVNFCMRSVLRLLPFHIKKIFYRIAR